MNNEALGTLQSIGVALDRHCFPRVRNGGLVVLNDSAVPSTLSTENSNGREKQRGPAARTRQGAKGRQGSSGGPRPPGAPAPVIGADLQSQIEEQLSGLQVYYPGTQFWNQGGGLWLLSPSRLLQGLDYFAILVVAINYSSALVRSWAFWCNDVMPASWIGPRHTNFPDGSICAFDVADPAWNWGLPLVTLLDMYTLWSVRQLHLSTFGRWPGGQAVYIPGERALEIRSDEYCGCKDGTKFYGDCCMQKDLARNRIADSLDLYWRGGGFRAPPEAICKFARDKSAPPPITEIIPSIDRLILSQLRTESSLLLRSVGTNAENCYAVSQAG